MGRDLHLGVEPAEMLDQLLQPAVDALGAVHDGLEAEERLVHALADGAEVGPEARQLAERGDPVADGVDPLAQGTDVFVHGTHVVADGVDPLAQGADVFIHGVHVVADRLDVLGQALRPGRRADGDVVQAAVDGLQRAAQPAELALPDLSQQPLHAFEALTDLVQHRALGPLLVDVILCRAGEELAHPIGDSSLTACLEQGVVGVIHRKLLHSPTVSRAVGLVHFAVERGQTARERVNSRPATLAS